MPRQAYLTIDDSPTKETDILVDFLTARDIPATLFAIGDSYKDFHMQCEGMIQNPQSIRRAIERGLVIGNHTYTHPSAKDLSYEQIVDEIEKTETLIDRLYKQTGKTRPAKLIRFPHIDRGCGGYVVDYEAAGKFNQKLRALFGDGLNVELIKPTQERIEIKNRVQDYLRKEGFLTDAFKGVTFPWYQGEMKAACDTLYTFSTADWAANPDSARYAKPGTTHARYKTLEALIQKIDTDTDLKNENSHHIILAHDHNNLTSITTTLIGHMQDNGIEFVALEP